MHIVCMRYVLRVAVNTLSLEHRVQQHTFSNSVASITQGPHQLQRVCEAGVLCVVVWHMHTPFYYPCCQRSVKHRQMLDYTYIYAQSAKSHANMSACIHSHTSHVHTQHTLNMHTHTHTLTSRRSPLSSGDHDLRFPPPTAPHSPWWPVRERVCSVQCVVLCSRE